MKKIAVSSLVSLFVLSCSVSAPNNSTQDTSSPLSVRMPHRDFRWSQYAPTNHYSPIKEDFTALAKKYNFAELEKEYKSFSTKALADTYVKKMFNKFLIVTPNSVQVIRQVEFSRYLKNNGDTSYETSLKNIFTDTPVLYSSLTGMPAVQSKMTSESGTFGFYILGVSPNETVPTALPATNITETSFTANWTAVVGATNYSITIPGKGTFNAGNSTSYNVTALSAETNYSYYVNAINSGVTSGNSNVINISTTPDIISGLVAYYPFNGNVNDESGNNNNGTNNGASLTTDRFGNTGKAYYFNGNGNYINIPDSSTLSPSGQVSISAWINCSGANTGNYYQAVLSKGYSTDYGIRMTREFNIYGEIKTNNGYFSNNYSDVISLNTWKLATMVYDGTTLSVYLNKTLINSIPATGNITDQNIPIFIGRNTYTYAEYFFGKIDDVRVYNRALTLTEISQIYHENGW